jgi:hypothetical protein
LRVPTVAKEAKMAKNEFMQKEWSVEKLFVKREGVKKYLGSCPHESGRTGMAALLVRLESALNVKLADKYGPAVSLAE